MATVKIDDSPEERRFHEAARRRYTRDRAALMQIFCRSESAKNWVVRCDGRVWSATDRRCGKSIWAKSCDELKATLKYIGVRSFEIEFEDK